MVTAVVRRASFHSISFVARPLRPHGKSHWVVPALELTPASSQHCTRCAYPHLRYIAREGVSQGPLPVGQTAALQLGARVRRTTHLCAPSEVVVRPFVPTSGEHKSSVKPPRLSVPPSVM